MILELLRWSIARQLARAGMHPVTIPLGQGRLHVYIGGNGPPVLFVHGALGGALLDWHACLAGVMRHYRAIVPELPGLGESASVVPPEEMSAPYIAELLAAALPALGVTEPFAVVGLSLGGVIALRLAQLRPTAITRLVLIAATGLPVTSHTPDEVVAALTPSTPGDLRRLLEAIFYRRLPLSEGILRDLWRSFQPEFAALRPLLRGLATGTEALTAAELRAITIPTTLIFAANDRLIPLAHGRKLAALLPQARLTVIPACGHADLARHPRRTTPLILRGLG